MTSEDRRAMREVYVFAWRKHSLGLPMEALDSQLVAIMLDHPEYHAMLDKMMNDPDNLDKDFVSGIGEENPFLHMSLHMAIREQVSVDRPKGIQAIYKSLVKRYQGSNLAAEHIILPILEKHLWQAQREGSMPDEQAYITELGNMTKL